MTRIALVGNPNAGKTTLFNELTGLRHKVGNYPGVTVDIKSGALRGADNTNIEIIDLPGVYSLTPQSPDEDVAVTYLFGITEAQPDFIVNVVDASNLERNLFLSTQLVELGIPMLVVLTMTDAAARRGLRVDEQRLATELGVPVVSTDAPKGTGLAALVSRLQVHGFGINIYCSLGKHATYPIGGKIFRDLGFANDTNDTKNKIVPLISELTPETINHPYFAGKKPLLSGELDYPVVELKKVKYHMFFRGLPDMSNIFNCY